MTRLIRAVVLLSLLPSLAQCNGWLPPYETVPTALPKGVASGGTRIGVCYNALTTTGEEVRAIAAQGCDPGRVPRPVKRDISLESCPLLQPARATFVCAAP